MDISTLVANASTAKIVLPLELNKPQEQGLVYSYATTIANILQWETSSVDATCIIASTYSIRELSCKFNKQVTINHLNFERISMQFCCCQKVKTCICKRDPYELIVVPRGCIQAFFNPMMKVFQTGFH